MRRNFRALEHILQMFAAEGVFQRAGRRFGNVRLHLFLLQNESADGEHGQCCKERNLDQL